MNKWKYLILCILLVPMIHWTQQAADRDRFDKVDISDRFYIPDPMATELFPWGIIQ